MKKLESVKNEMYVNNLNVVKGGQPDNGWCYELKKVNGVMKYVKVGDKA